MDVLNLPKNKNPFLPTRGEKRTRSMSRRLWNYELPTGGLASTGHFVGLASLGLPSVVVYGPHRPGVPRESASPPLGGLRWLSIVSN